ncbi:MAG: nicotinate-nucleotide--dimethylbenzimidazole phosphoribosyltransferase [Nitrospinales bacterium]
MASRILQTLKKIKPLPPHLLGLAQEHMDSLTKPQGSLGKLEEWGTRYAAINNFSSPPSIKKCVYLFAGDHGVVHEKVSAYPQEVTAQMVKNFLSGGAAINVLARHINTDVKVIDIGVNHDFENLPDLIHKKISMGTDNMTLGPSMTREQAEKAIEVGLEMADSAKDNDINIIGTGDMGIGNTTPSSAIISVLGGFHPKDTTGKGTGIDDSGWQHKVSVIEKAIALNKPSPENSLDVLAKVGGYEIAGIAGLILGAASNSTPIVIDGFISIAGAVIAQKLNKYVKDYLFVSHKSSEPGCEKGFQILQQRPLLDLDMRLGEGTGAVIAMNLLEAGQKIYSEMSTFESASVSSKNRI